MDIGTILSRLPYSKPFLFVDALTAVGQDGVVGTCTFPVDSWFYQGHFKDHPVTPGVILTETMAQIGVVCLGILLLGDETDGCGIALTATDIEFLNAVGPGETVTVTSKKIYFRFGKLKCEVTLKRSDGSEACTGTISGMIINTNKRNG